MREAGFIFDLDGTLFDSEIQIFQAINAARSKRGFSKLPLHSVSTLIGLSARELVKDLALPEEETTQIVTEFREELSLEIKRENVMFEGARDFIQAASNLNIPIGVATSKPTSLALTVIENSEIFHLIQHVQGTDGFAPKPDPTVILQCMDKLGIKKALMFGDRREDMLSALFAGAVGIGISQTFHTPEELIDAGASLVFASFIEAKNKIQLLIEMVES